MLVVFVVWKVSINRLASANMRFVVSIKSLNLFMILGLSLSLSRNGFTSSPITTPNRMSLSAYPEARSLSRKFLVALAISVMGFVMG